MGGEIWGLIGVALGFVLAEVAGWWRQHGQRRRLLRAIRAECRTLLAQAKRISEGCDRAEAAVATGQVPNLRLVPPIDVVYRGWIHTLAPHLSPKDLALLQWAYSWMDMAVRDLSNLVERFASGATGFDDKQTVEVVWATIRGNKERVELVRHALGRWPEGDTIDVYGPNP
jgi:hypothetical protein